MDGKGYYASSRNSDGKAVYANWNDRQFKINWWNRDDANPNGRTREVVLPKRGVLRALFLVGVFVPASCHLGNFL